MAYLQIKIYVNNAINFVEKNGELLLTYGEEKVLLVIYISINARKIQSLLLKKFKLTQTIYKIDIINNIIISIIMSNVPPCIAVIQKWNKDKHGISSDEEKYTNYP